MKHLIAGWAACVLACLGAVAASAAEMRSPVGLWQTVDDKTGQPRAEVRIYAMGGELYGRIEKSYTPGAEKRTCVKCKDERKGQPMLGLVIIRRLHRDGGDTWTGGDILDPESGSVYRCRLEVSPDDHSLSVRGYIGFALLGRTQTWKRLASG